MAHLHNFAGQAGVIMGNIGQKIKQTAEISLAIAMASLGLSTNLKSLVSLGVRPFYLGLVAATSVGIVSFLTIKLIIV